ncbi:MAG TPA: flagellar FlbD family protein [Pirellulales bacterium]|nr:flagellar FlbD family protein [Pirellulales bacterium]
MIKLTQLGGEPFVLNAELIKYVESRPDTIVTLIGGDRIVVRETMDEVVCRALDYQKSKHLFPPIDPRQPWTSRQSAASAAALR